MGNITYTEQEILNAGFDPTTGASSASLATALAGEDFDNDVMRVEGQFSYSRKTADGQVKSAPGFVHSVTIAPTTATPTAGLVTVYDNTAGSGTPVFSEWVFATAPAHSVILDVECLTSIYVEYDGTLANVSVTISYR